MPDCPVCNSSLPSSIPAYCSCCGWDTENDPTLVPSLGNISDSDIDKYRRRLALSQAVWNRQAELSEELAVMEKKVETLTQIIRSGVFQGSNGEGVLPDEPPPVKRKLRRKPVLSAPDPDRPSTPGRKATPRSAGDHRVISPSMAQGMASTAKSRRNFCMKLISKCDEDGMTIPRDLFEEIEARYYTGYSYSMLECLRRMIQSDKRVKADRQSERDYVVG